MRKSDSLNPQLLVMSYRKFRRFCVSRKGGTEEVDGVNHGPFTTSCFVHSTQRLTPPSTSSCPTPFLLTQSLRTLTRACNNQHSLFAQSPSSLHALPEMKVEFLSLSMQLRRVRGGPPGPSGLWVTPPTSLSPTLSTDTEPTVRSVM